MTPEELREAIAAASRERSTQMRAPGDRPRQRRNAEISSSPSRVHARAAMVVSRAAASSDTVGFEGIASAYEQGYTMYDFYGPYTEIMSAGAGAVSLAQPDLDVPLVLQHDSLRRIARTTNGTLQLSESDQGLHAVAPELELRDADVAYIIPKIESGLVDEMSFMFTITSGQWSPDYTEYRINSYDIQRGDVAIVGYGANPYTSAQLRAAITALRDRRELTGDEQRALQRAFGLDAAGINDLSTLTVEALRGTERAIRKELTRRRLSPAMSLHDLMRIE